PDAESALRRPRTRSCAPPIRAPPRRAILLVMATGRIFVFVSALEPLAAAEAVWSAPTPIDLCVAAPSRVARETAAFAVAGRPISTVFEPLLETPRLNGSVGAHAARAADALLALYALDTRTALVVWDDPEVERSLPPTVDEAWLLEHAERIDRVLPLP